MQTALVPYQQDNLCKRGRWKCGSGKCGSRSRVEN